MKKVVAVILAAVMCIGVFSSFSFAAEAQDTYKVGVILYDTECQWAKDIMGCLRAIGEPLGVTFETAIGGTDPEVTIEDVQNFGAAGYNGIVNLHPGTVMSKLVEVCEQYGMYIVTSNDPSSASADYAQFSASEYFAGEVWEDEKQIAGEIIQSMYDNGATEFGLHGFPYGLSAQMDARLDGARAKLAELGVPEENIHEGLSFDKAGAADELLSSFPGMQAIFSSVETVSTVYQPLINSGKSGEVMLNCYDPNDDALYAFEDGTLSYATTGTCADSMIAFVLLYNAMTGNKMVQEDGSAASINMRYLFCQSAEDFQAAMDYCSADHPAYTLEELTPFIGPDASFADLKAFAEKFSLEDVQARHAN
ncbi:MAG: sugar ABC transporter substrate-binding protein [Parasporobacterium sp.]|nr:sugar ABC transporter substrate-binding protein [Parasporobacterium sp.]